MDSLNQPGFVRLADNGERAQRRAEDRALQKAELSAAWKGGLQDGDHVTIGDRCMELVGRNPNTGKVVLADTAALDAAAVKQAAYDHYEQQLNSAWQTDGATLGERAGDECTINGAPGHLVREGGKLVCRPDEHIERDRKVVQRDPMGPLAATFESERRKPDPDEWSMGGPLSDATEARAVKDAAYEQYADELENAWRTR